MRILKQYFSFYFSLKGLLSSGFMQNNLRTLRKGLLSSDQGYLTFLIQTKGISFYGEELNFLWFNGKGLLPNHEGVLKYGLVKTVYSHRVDEFLIAKVMKLHFNVKQYKVDYNAFEKW